MPLNTNEKRFYKYGDINKIISYINKLSRVALNKGGKYADKYISHLNYVIQLDRNINLTNKQKGGSILDSILYVIFYPFKKIFSLIRSALENNPDGKKNVKTKKSSFINLTKTRSTSSSSSNSVSNPKSSPSQIPSQIPSPSSSPSPSQFTSSSPSPSQFTSSSPSSGSTNPKYIITVDQSLPYNPSNINKLIKNKKMLKKQKYEIIGKGTNILFKFSKKRKKIIQKIKNDYPYYNNLNSGKASSSGNALNIMYHSSVQKWVVVLGHECQGGRDYYNIFAGKYDNKDKLYDNSRNLWENARREMKEESRGVFSNLEGINFKGIIPVNPRNPDFTIDGSAIFVSVAQPDKFQFKNNSDNNTIPCYNEMDKIAFFKEEELDEAYLTWKKSKSKSTTVNVKDIGGHTCKVGIYALEVVSSYKRILDAENPKQNPNPNKNPNPKKIKTKQKTKSRTKVKVKAKATAKAKNTNPNAVNTANANSKSAKQKISDFIKKNKLKRILIGLYPKVTNNNYNINKIKEANEIRKILKEKYPDKNIYNYNQIQIAKRAAAQKKEGNRAAKSEETKKKRAAKRTEAKKKTAAAQKKKKGKEQQKVKKPKKEQQKEQKKEKKEK